MLKTSHAEESPRRNNTVISRIKNCQTTTTIIITTTTIPTTILIIITIVIITISFTTTTAIFHTKNCQTKNP